ncbi:universal stress protein [Desulfoferrobacter suflitae]|uniref:universal stress protein n=1 Tax=Desulfoferrobacter suflitae TaxID=2865782 RepID=UPI00216416B7|nr:universal stress protein [Desulfoferrobacter suflitae]MCK8600783.1 universal stress protein [Desulfoferrobacter suflitae]
MMDDVKRILVVSRSTQNCRKAVHYGVSLAKKYGTELYVVHVIHDPFSLEGWNLPVPSLHEEYERLKEAAKDDLDRIISKEKAEGLTIHEWVRDGKPVEEILNIVENEQIDLLIMLAHQEGRLEHFLFGRTNETIVRKMPCAILLVH